MKIQANGETIDVEPGRTIQAFLAEKGINPRIVACELNTKILKRAEFDRTVLKEGDVLEIIRMIGGG